MRPEGIGVLRVAAGLLAAVLLTGCLPGGELGGLNPTAANEPPAASATGQGVDGLLVGHRLMEAGEYELALRAYYRAAGEQGLNADVLSAIGSANLMLGRLGQAETVLRQAIAEDPRSVPALNNLGCVLMELGRPAEARYYFEQAYALDSGLSDEIRENLKLALAQVENLGYAESEETDVPQYSLIRRGESEYELLSDL